MVHGNLVCGEVCPVAQYFHLHHSGWFVERCALWPNTSFSTTQGGLWRSAMCLWRCAMWPNTSFSTTQGGLWRGVPCGPILPSPPLRVVCGEVCPVAQYFLLHHSGWFVERCALWPNTSFSTTQGLYPVVQVWKDGICEKLMWAESLCTTHLNILWRVWCAQTHWCANSPQWSWRIWRKQTNLRTNPFHSPWRIWWEQIHWCSSHLIVLEVWCGQPCLCAAHFRVGCM